MNITLIVSIAVVAILNAILILMIVEVFVFEKAFREKGIDYLINLSSIISKNQLKEILRLLETDGPVNMALGRRITIYGYKWQYAFFYLMRVVVAHLHKQLELIKEYKKIMIKDTDETLSMGGYLDKYNIIEIYEFNLKRAFKKEDINILKVKLVTIIAHEFRHRLQEIYQLEAADEEADARMYAIEFYNNYKQELKEILNLSHIISIKNIFHS